MKISKSKNVKDVGFMEEKFIEMGKDLSDLRLRESTMMEKLETKKHKVERETARERNTTCHSGKSLYGNLIMQETIKILCYFPQGTVTTIPNEDTSIVWILSFSRIQELY